MTTLSSMQYTIGTALGRAREGGLSVEILVDNHWLDGLVVAVDGHGVVLDKEGRDHYVVRLERIAAVRVGAEAPSLDTLPTEDAGTGGAPFDGAVPMPGPQSAGV